jgi:hypothetical protein
MDNKVTVCVHTNSFFPLQIIQDKVSETVKKVQTYMDRFGERIGKELCGLGILAAAHGNSIPLSFEEVTLRYGLQHLLLKTGLQQGCKKLGWERTASFLDSKVWTATRIGIASAIFSLVHSNNKVSLMTHGLLIGTLFETARKGPF